MLSSVRPSVTRVNHTKTVKGRIMKCSPYGSLIPLVFAGYVSSRSFNGSPPPAEGSNKGGLGENQPLSSFKRQYLETGRRYVHS